MATFKCFEYLCNYISHIYPPPFTSTLGCGVIPKFLHSHGLINLGLIRVFNPHDQENILSVLGDTYFLFASLSVCSALCSF